MFQENGDPCVKHGDGSICIYAIDVDEGTIATGACDCSNGNDRCGDGDDDRCL